MFVNTRALHSVALAARCSRRDIRVGFHVVPQISDVFYDIYFFIGGCAADGQSLPKIKSGRNLSDNGCIDWRETRTTHTHTAQHTAPAEEWSHTEHVAAWRPNSSCDSSRAHKWTGSGWSEIYRAQSALI